MLKLLGTIAIAFGVAVAAQAALPVPVARAPEIDPGSALSALTLLGGALAVVAGRRLRK